MNNNDLILDHLFYFDDFLLNSFFFIQKPNYQYIKRNFN